MSSLSRKHFIDIQGATKEDLAKMGIDYSKTIMDKADSFEDALENTPQYLEGLAREFISSF